ncbi:transcriptional regulator family: Fungal Specific TF [Paecilomyces variotii]|nr:transcriptional regulator family: Fungal Specific TF [Paecilomyces variotii]KAJ9209094.1 transcriptional regulator family: Fungal Specific TF [Paecilomyces variotii]KAJ9282974.1 transcriptional regulator family: Fungal Specific TF [Paecilomyces variotii]KAJ9343821.1 transcriptional regulator family: Fungal Specific TF [Paecilomyces variotii]KAJ9386976.1 transcriptional regulator family: Fungal Specific TF [Paecilomyces variotii]
MARQKVAPENRIRAARACENCKRRKQKCNGTYPCDNCSKRAVDCMFIQPVPATTQRRLSQKHRDGPEGQWRRGMSAPSIEGGDSNVRGSFSVSGSMSESTQSQDGLGAGAVIHQSPTSQSILTGDPLPSTNEMDSSRQPAGQSGSSETDEAEMQEASRMLNDGKGRMLYIGDSAPLSYLQTIRQLVGTVVGSSAFTIDPQRHKILEASVSIPPPHQHTCTLPDREVAFFLVESFFANTKGIMHIFDECLFKQKVDRTYQNPLAAEPSWLCILNLVFANGLQLRSASPQRSASEAAILRRLSSDKVDRSEMFFVAAKHFRDSVSGFEDGDFASIQALLLMTLYMLTAAKRNTAWAYFGMAVRLAYALGLHRVETQLIFNESERVSTSVHRMMLWKSLYVMDRFISACLGRPTAIHDDDCSDALFSSNNIAPNPPHGDQSFLSDTLTASVQSAKILGVILNRVYRKRKISLKIARGIAVDIHNWTQSLPEFLQWNPVPTPHDDPAIALAQLHIWLMYFQNIVLLTRPFLLLHVKKILDEHLSGSQASQPNANSPAENKVAENPELKKYSAACVRSAIHMIRAIQAIRVKGCLPRRNPFIIHWMFTAGLIVLTNSFFNIYENPENDSIAQRVLALHQYCAETDLQSKRYLTILTSFQKTIVYAKTSNMPVKESTQQDPIENLFNATQPAVAGLSPTNNAMTSNYLSAQNTWDWRSKDAQSDVMQDITATGINGQHSGESVEGLIYPGSEDLVGPDLSTIHEEFIHFDALWPLNQDSADLLPSQIHLYGTTPFT